MIVALQLGLNLLNINVLALLNTVSAWWHMAGVLVVVAVLTLVPENHQSVGFVFGEVINNSGFSDSAIWFVFGLGLLMSQYTITGYDASAHMSEETRQASRTAALGMVMAVVASVFFGFILLVAVTFAVPDVQGTLDAAGNAVVYIWTESLGETWAAFLLVIAVIAQLFCGTASVTASSRMMFAFSRDRAVPFHNVWRKVASNRVPVNAVTAIAVLSWALMIPTLANGVVGYAVGTSIAVIGLYIAFGIPIILRIKAGDRFEAGAWTLGERYKWISTISVVWIGLVCILFLMPLTPAGVPGSEDFSWEAVNYAPITVFGALVLFGGWYLLSARTWFTGPVPEGGSLAELQSIEQQLDAEAGGKAAVATTATAGAAAAGAVAVAEKTEADTEAADKTDDKADASAEVTTEDKVETATEEPAAAATPEAAAETPDATAGTPDAPADAEGVVTAEATDPEAATEEPKAEETGDAGAATTADATSAATDAPATADAPAEAEAATEDAPAAAADSTETAAATDGKPQAAADTETTTETGADVEAKPASANGTADVTTVAEPATEPAAETETGPAAKSTENGKADAGTEVK